MTEVPGLMVKEDLEVNVFLKIFLVLIQYNSKILESIIEYNNTLRDDIPKNEK